MRDAWQHIVAAQSEKSRPLAAMTAENLDRTTILLYHRVMPLTDVIYYRNPDGSIPVLDWLDQVARRDQRAVTKCAAAIAKLRQYGHALRRPTSDYLRDGIYELRIRAGRVQFRMLYFFHGQNAVVLTHGLVKEKAVPSVDIERAISRKAEFERAPEQYSFHEDT